MGRKKTEFYKNQDEVWQEELDDIERVKKSVVKNLNKDAIEKDRELIINNLMELNDILESHRIRKINKADVPRGKNILQSLVYLILNDRFYAGIVSVRKKLGIPADGFNRERQYGQWAVKYTKKYCLDFKKKKIHQNMLRAGKVRLSKHVLSADGFNRAYEETKHLVKKNRLANARDESNLATILMYFLTRRLKFEKFFQVIVPMIAERKYDSLTAGFDVKVKEMPNSQDYYKCEWAVRLYPFTNLTGFDKSLKIFFEKEISHERNKCSYDETWVKIQLRKLKNIKKKHVSNAGLSVVDGGNVVILKFTTDFFTKPSQIIKAYKNVFPKVNRILKHKADEIQKKFLSENFYRNYRVFLLQKKGLTYKEIDSQTARENLDISGITDSIKWELGEFKANIRNSLRRKIIF